MKQLILNTIKLYQKLFSFDHAFWAQPHKFRICIHFPSCSQYTYEAVERFGIIKGLRLGFFRVLRCNIFFKGGIDEVPKK